ncbi:MAG: WD40 repeat domain-containing protein [Chloroflexi bacterium]|nr:WD40 repeat domain-containing protein [Chloroflexota bacterium]
MKRINLRIVLASGLIGIAICALAGIALTALGALNRLAAPQPLRAAVVAPNNASRIIELSKWENVGVRQIAWSADGKSLAIASAKGLYLAGLPDFVAVQPIEIGRPAWSVASAHNSSTFAYVKQDSRIAFHSEAQNNPLPDLVGHQSVVYALAFSPDDARLASVSDDKTIRMWDATLGRALWKSSLVDQVRSVAFSPDGKSVAAGTFATAQIFDAASGRVIATLTGKKGWVSTLAFSPDGKILAAGFQIRESLAPIQLWSVESQREIATLQAAGAIRAVAFSPDGKILATGSAVITLWDVASQQSIATLTGHTDGVNCIYFSPDGTLLASGSDDGTVRVWGVKP